MKQTLKGHTMIRTLASDEQTQKLAQFFISKEATQQQTYEWLRQHKYTVKGVTYRAMKVLGYMQQATASK